jgi:hypothetical protein
MKVRLNPNGRGVLKTNRGEYHRAIENLGQIYFVNYSEDDKRFRVKLFNRKRDLISEDEFANSEMVRVMTERGYSWVSDRMKEFWQKNKENLVV